MSTCTGGGGAGRSGAGRLVAGVDEAGRGPLAGPVVAAAVILDPMVRIEGLADSKRLSAQRRAELDLEIRERALSCAVAGVGADVIDAVNILQATMRAMRDAVARLDPPPEEVLVDGNRCPELPYRARAVVRGDASVAAISAASILAKVARDREMIEMDRRYPEYGFARHKGYGTRAHRDALLRFGPSPIHRLSFAPVRSALVRNGPGRNRS